MGATIFQREGTVGRDTGGARRIARGQRKPGDMNRLETEYANWLKAGQQLGQIDWFAYEAIKLRLADNTFYTPDFFVMAADGSLECHEIKGFWEDDARVKIKVAATLFPFKFVAVSKAKKADGGGWVIEEF